MVTILSAFLGFVLGVQPVELSVMGDVAAVELRLDEQTVATLRGEPWVVAVDFGSELAPHEILAIAKDREGREIWRALRRLNVPQARSQVELVLQPASAPGASVRAGMVWRSVDGETPDEWLVTLDGERIEVADPSDFALPAYDDSEPHVLEAGLLFGRGVARGELVFGGSIKDSVSSDLTALVFERVTDQVPTADEMAGWLSRRGRPLEVVAVEQAGADIVAVHEATPRAWGSLSKLRRQVLESSDRNPLKARLSSGLNHDDRLRVVLPIGESRPGRATKFHLSPDFSTIEYGAATSGVALQQIAQARAYGFLATFPYPPEGPLTEDAPRQTADAVAVAAQVAAAANRARAVVLVREVGTPDSSRHDPAIVRRYLERLQVPLFVWSVGRPGRDQGWGEDEGVGSPEKFLRVSLALREALNRQVVVWVRGRHLAHEVELSAGAGERLRAIGSGAPAPATPADSDFLPWIAEEHLSDPRSETAAPTATTPIQAIEPAVETFAEAVDVRLVNVDVVVTDRDEQPVYGLGPADFELYEDGEPVEIRHLDAPATRSADAVSAPGEAVSEAGADDAPSLVIFLETGSLDDRARKSLAAALREVLAGEDAERDAAYRTMLVTHDRTMEIQTALSAEPVSLRETLQRIERGELGKAPARDERSDVLREIARVRAALNASRPTARNDRDVLVSRLVAVGQELATEVRQTLAALRRLISGLGAVEGRKVLLYVGNGLELSPGEELFDEAVRTLGLIGRDLSMLQVEARAVSAQGGFDGLLADANANGVTLYTLAPPNRRVADDVEGTSAAATGFAGRGGGSRTEATKAAACLLSGQTGGLCQVGAVEPALLLERARRDLVASYTLAFAPRHPADGEYHELEVRLRDSELARGTSVRHRVGFTDAVPESRAHDQLAAALVFGVEANALGVTLEVGSPTPASTAGLQLFPLELRVPVARLGVQSLADGESFGFDAQLLLATRDANGATTAVQEYPISFQVERSKLEATTELIYAHKIHLTLPPGEHEVAIGLWDAIGKGGSFVTRRIGVEERGRLSAEGS